MGSSETLYSAVGSLHLSAEWTLLDYLRAIRELATGLGAYEACVQPSHNGDGGKADDHVLKVSRLMRRDMCLQSAVGGLTLVLAGLLVPIEVTGTRLAEGGTKLTIDFLVVGAAPKPLSMSVAMDATLPLEARDANLLLALAPALAVFLREHGTHDMAAPLGKAARAPVVPEPMLCAARSVSKKDACIGDVLVRARRAMQQAGHRVPNLGFLKLGGCTLEAWLDLHANYMERAAMVEERLAETARAMKRKIEEVDADMKAMVDCLHQTRRHFMLCVAHGLRSLP